MCVDVCVCEGWLFIQKSINCHEDNSPGNYSEQPAVSEAHHKNLSTGVILASTFLCRYQHFHEKRIITQFFHSRLGLLAVYDCVFIFSPSFHFLPQTAETSYCRISELLWMRGCLIHSYIWMASLWCDSN